MEERIANLSKMDDVAVVTLDEQSNVQFGEVASGKDSTEVCRMFLACLQLANLGNVTIAKEGNGYDQQHFPFALKLNRISSRLEEIENFRTSADNEIEAGSVLEASNKRAGILQDAKTNKKKPTKIRKQKSLDDVAAVEDQEQDAANIQDTDTDNGKNPTKRNHSGRTRSGQTMAMQKTLSL
jgi:hypothetical protein